MGNCVVLLVSEIHTHTHKNGTKIAEYRRATLPLTADTKELTDCMCPHLSNLNHNHGSDVNAPNVVTNLSNISHQGHYETEQLRFEASPVTEITTNNSNGDVINETTTSTSPTDGPLRHSSMDRLMSLLNDMGQSPRTRSLSDGGQEEGKVQINFDVAISRDFFLFFFGN